MMNSSNVSHESQALADREAEAAQPRYCTGGHSAAAYAAFIDEPEPSPEEQAEGLSRLRTAISAYRREVAIRKLAAGF
jgi:hypothetical protein